MKQNLQRAFNKQPSPAKSGPTEIEQENFIRAAGADDCAAVEAFLEKYPSAIDIQSNRMFVAQTALMQAVARGKKRIVTLLIDHGASRTARNSLGQTPLDILEEHLGMIETMTEPDLKRDLLQSFWRIEHTLKHPTYFEKNSFIEAAGRGDNAAVNAFLDQHPGAINVLEDRTYVHNMTALMNAAVNGKKDTVELLLKRGADVNAVNFVGWTALNRALAAGNTELAAILRRHGANPSQPKYPNNPAPRI